MMYLNPKKSPKDFNIKQGMKYLFGFITTLLLLKYLSPEAPVITIVFAIVQVLYCIYKLTDLID